MSLSYFFFAHSEHPECKQKLCSDHSNRSICNIRSIYRFGAFGVFCVKCYEPFRGTFGAYENAFSSTDFRQCRRKRIERANYKQRRTGLSACLSSLAVNKRRGDGGLKWENTEVIVKFDHVPRRPPKNSIIYHNAWWPRPENHISAMTHTAELNHHRCTSIRRRW